MRHKEGRKVGQPERAIKNILKKLKRKLKKEKTLGQLVERMEDDFQTESTEGHTVIPPTRRPDGSLRKPIRVRAGYVPQDEIAAWDSPAKRMQRERERVGVPGWVGEATPKAAPSRSSSNSSTVVGAAPMSQAPAPKLTKNQKRNLARKKGREEKRKQEGGNTTGTEALTKDIAKLAL